VPKNIEGYKPTFCVFCETSQDNKVEAFLTKAGYDVISTLAERNIVKNGKLVKGTRSVIPGYVFFENEIEPDWDEICKYRHIYYALHYGDNTKELKNNDLHFVKWLKSNNGIIKISKAIKIGNKVKIMEGPLKDLEGKIVKINNRQKCAGIKIGGEGISCIIWLSYEYIV
jgi:transcriptional antiterminator NusG